MLKLSKSILLKRVNMLFHYQKGKSKRLSMLLAYFILFFTAVSSAYAFNDVSIAPVAQHIIKHSQ